jgi:hypothetical protein
MDIVHRPEFKTTGKHDFLEIGSVSAYTRGKRETPTLLGPVERTNLSPAQPVQWLRLAL